MSETSRIIQGTITKLLPVQLTPTECDNYAHQLALEVAVYNEKEKTKKVEMKFHTDALKEQRRLVDDISAKVRDKVEDREVQCTVMHDYKRGVVQTYRDDLNELVEVRPMTAQEMEDGLQLEF